MDKPHFYFKPMDNKSPQNWWEPALRIFAQATAWVVFPVLLALFLGRYLDEKFGSAPYIFLSLTFLAFIVSIATIVSISLKYIKDIEGCIENSTISHTDTWKENFNRGFIHFKKKYGFGPTEVPDSKPEQVQNCLNYLFQNK